MRVRRVRASMAGMPDTHAAHAAFGRQPKQVVFDPDTPIQWGCSAQGWNCCVDKGIVVRPYDMVRLRHALGQPSHAITGERTVTFAWHPPTGALVGSLAHRPYGPGHVACVCYEELTNKDAARIRADDPARFAALPRRVQAAADAPTSREYRVAGLCTAHLNRPEVCRAFPYQRQTHVEPDGTTTAPTMIRINLCGSCALSTPTTPRAIAESEDTAEYWRANDAFSTVMAYYRSRGAARMGHAGYRALPLGEPELTQLWAAMYLPDSDPAITGRFGEQWRAPLDVAGDREVYRLLLARALDRLDALLAAGGHDPSHLDTTGAPEVARPDLDALLDPERAVLPPPYEVAAAA